MCIDGAQPQPVLAIGQGTELGITLPTPVAPVANYVPFRISGNLLVVAGQICVGPDGKIADRHKGKLGGAVTPDAGAEAARFCAINLFSQAKAALGNLDRITACLRLGDPRRCTCDPATRISVRLPGLHGRQPGTEDQPTEDLACPLRLGSDRVAALALMAGGLHLSPCAELARSRRQRYALPKLDETETLDNGCEREACLQNLLNAVYHATVLVLILCLAVAAARQRPAETPDPANPLAHPATNL